jgi:cell division protein FtsN
MSQHKQRGGTILGFIFGLVVGLGIAVGVAMVVTKSYGPFTNKQGNHGKISELTASQTADPNKPLYGNREAVKEAAKSLTKDDDSKGDNPADVKENTKAKKDDGKKDAKADGMKEVKPDDKAAADKQKKADAAKDAADKKDKADEKWTYYLQTNAFRESADAEGARAKLALSGFEARISETSSQGNPLYRVRMGPFSNIETMNRVRGKLTDSGVDAAVIRIPK